MFANIVWPPKLANIPSCCVFVIQIIYGNCIFSHSLAKLANMPQGKKVGKHITPSRGGWNTAFHPLLHSCPNPETQEKHNKIMIHSTPAHCLTGHAFFQGRVRRQVNLSPAIVGLERSRSLEERKQGGRIYMLDWRDRRIICGR